MTTNFLQFNPSGTNAETDAAYASDTTRTGGFVVNTAASSPLFNKVFLQCSTMVAAIGQVLSNSGQNVADNNYSGLQNSIISVLANQLPQYYVAGPPPQWASNTTLTIPTGLSVRSIDNTADIVVTSPLTLNIGGSGANGLDTGTVAANTWYYVYLIKNVTTGTVAALFSVTNEAASGSITLPSGYTVKRQLRLACRTDASSHILNFVITRWGDEPLIEWQAYPGTTTAGIGDDAAGGSSSFLLLAGGTASSNTIITCTQVIPPISTLGFFKAFLACASNNTTAYFGSGTTDYQGITVENSAAVNSYPFIMPTTSSQTIYYRMVGTRVGAYCLGFVVNGVL